MSISTGLRVGEIFITLLLIIMVVLLRAIPLPAVKKLGP